VTCAFCGGPAHPATGCQYTATMIACRACTVDFWRWVRQHTNGRPRQRKGAVTSVSFYEAAGKVWP